MRISFTTLGCPEWSWDQIVAAAVGNGYDGIEVRGVQGEMDLTKAYPFLPETIGDTISDLKEKGLAICCLDTSCSFHDKNALEWNMAQAKGHIDLAQKLGAPFIRIFGNDVPKDADKAEIMARISGCLKELGTYSSDRGVEVLLETHGDFSRSKDVLEIVDMAGHTSIAVLWDVHHPYRFFGETLSESWSNLKGRVRVTHLKDSVPLEGGGHRYVLTGEGDVPIGDCVRLLKAEAPEVWLSLEWEKKWIPTLEEPEVAIPHFIRKIREYLV